MNVCMPSSARPEQYDERKQKIMSCSCNDHGGTTSGRRDYQYAVKVVVGSIPKTDPEFPLPAGNYFTKVNVHNSSRCDCVTFKWKVAVGHPGLGVGPISGFSEATLCADEALEIVNRDMFSKLEEVFRDALPAHFEGWVVIETPEELDVVAVYASSGIDHDQVSALHTERVQPRCMIACEDLYGDISTGTAMWEVQRPGESEFNWAFLSRPHAAWVTTPDAVWVTPSENGFQVREPQGNYTYRLPFKLCSGFSDASIRFALAADNRPAVFLNGQAVNPTSGTPNTTLTNFTSLTDYVITTGFQSGSNELTIVVYNEGGPTGLLVHGSLEVKGGQCPGEEFPRWPCPDISYQVHVRKLFPWVTGADGWLSWTSNGDMAGTIGQHRRIEAYRAVLAGTVAPGTQIEYCGLSRASRN